LKKEAVRMRKRMKMRMNSSPMMDVPDDEK
jgi:hypothetical protein